MGKVHDIHDNTGQTQVTVQQCSPLDHLQHNTQRYFCNDMRNKGVGRCVARV